MEKTELLPCPLCYDLDELQINSDGVYKPEIVCNNCGIALQGETVAEAVQGWNARTPPPLTDQPLAVRYNDLVAAIQQTEILCLTCGFNVEIVIFEPDKQLRAVCRKCESRTTSPLTDELLSKAIKIQFEHEYDAIEKSQNGYRAWRQSRKTEYFESKDGFATPQEAFAWIMEGRDGK